MTDLPPQQLPDHLSSFPEFDGNTYVGGIEVHPRLNDAEVDHLNQLHALSETEWRPGKVAEARRAFPEFPAVVDQDVWCGWRPTYGGERLVLQGGELTGQPVRWLRWLIGHLLSPAAAGRRLPRQCDGFTLDHRLHGMVVGEAAYGELVVIRVRDNRVRERVLWPTQGAPARTRPRVADPARVTRLAGVVTLDSRRRKRTEATGDRSDDAVSPRRPVS